MDAIITKKDFLSLNKTERQRLFGCVEWNEHVKRQLCGLDLQDSQPHDDSQLWDADPSPWVDGFQCLNACENESLVIS